MFILPLAILAIFEPNVPKSPVAIPVIQFDAAKLFKSVPKHSLSKSVQTSPTSMRKYISRMQEVLQSGQDPSSNC